MTHAGIVYACLIGGIPMGLVFLGWLWHASVIGMRNNMRERELQSQERMKAIECGYPLDQPKLMTAAISIGVGVPGAAVGGAFMATAMNAGNVAWPAAAVMGVSAVVCATILAIKAANQSTKDDLRLKPTLGRERPEMADYHR